MKKLILICIAVGLCQTLAWSQAAKRATTPKASNRTTLRNQMNEAAKAGQTTPAVPVVAPSGNSTAPLAGGEGATDPQKTTVPVRADESAGTTSSPAATAATAPQKKTPSVKVTDGVTVFRPADEGRKMLPLVEHRPEDIIWNRRVWRRVPLQERVNRPLYFPISEEQDRKSLTQTLVNGIMNGSLTAFDPDVDDQFSAELSPTKVLERADALDKTTTRKSLQTGRDTTFVVKGAFPYSEIKELLVKEDWFFDKHYSRLFIRIVGICPVRVYSKTNNAEGAEDESNMLKKQLFWINYDQARPLLAEQKMFLEGNDRTGYSFDDLFLQRRFSSYIVKESSENVSASIQDYIKNEYQQMIEGERIQNKLLNFEQDLWEY